VLNTVGGCTIPFNETPIQIEAPSPFRLNNNEHSILNSEVKKLWLKGVVKTAVHTPGEFISNLFLRPKPNGEFRMILDLTKLNKQVEYKHFKMFSLHTARQLITPGAFMASIDLQDAYYSVPIAEEHRKFLRFIWREQLFEYTCLPNGLAPCPRIFTRLLKPIFSVLGDRGFTLFPYIDDSFIVAPSQAECAEAIKQLSQLFISLGFKIHPTKSVLQPVTELTFLGFSLNSESMLIKVTDEKIQKFITFVAEISGIGRKLKIRKIASLVGLMTAYSQAVLYGGAHIKTLEIDKNLALKKAKGNFERLMIISKEAWTDINWWLQNIETSPSPIIMNEPSVTVTTDASLLGWGAHSNGVEIGGRWRPEEAQAHINVLELRAVHLALTSLIKETHITVHVLTDNMTTLSHIRKMGGTHSPTCNQEVKKIWNWAESSCNWLTAGFIKGKDNVTADFKSRNFHDHLEWELNNKLFNKICVTWGLPQVDLFASRNNFKCKKYVAWHPEPEAWQVDAFSIKWNSEFCYAFPPFSLVARVARKIVRENAHVVLVAPAWSSQPGVTAARRWADDEIAFPRAPKNLLHSGPLVPGGDVSSTPLSAFLFLRKA